MQISLHAVTGFSEQGKRAQNEDFIYPSAESATVTDKLFIVCDGVGGAAAGDIASQQTALTVAKQLQHQCDFTTAIHGAQRQLSDLVQQYPASQHLATTITVLQIQQSGIRIGHIGDSRIYQFRDGQIIFQTQDHSLVNELLAEGIINNEQAAVHPQRNVITRAVQTVEEGLVDIETQLITDVKNNDFFLLCTDGILEGFTDDALERLFKKDLSTVDLAANLREECQQFARDNYSAYVLKVKTTETTSAPSPLQTTNRDLPLFPFIILLLVALFLLGHYLLN